MCVCGHILKVFLAKSLNDCLWEFHPIYNVGAVGDKDELSRS